MIKARTDRTEAVVLPDHDIQFLRAIDAIAQISDSFIDTGLYILFSYKQPELNSYIYTLFRVV